MGSRRRRLGALALAFAASCAGEDTLDERPDVLLITLDTFRADHVSADGSSWARTPVIDALARQGIIFQRHYTVANTTAPSHATLFTGKHPREHGARRNGIPLHAGLLTLPQVLASEGYETSAFLGAAVLGSSYGFERGFQVFDEEFELGVYEVDGVEHPYERAAESVIDSARTELARPSEAPRFVWVHLFDPHLTHRRPHEEWPPLDELVADGRELPAESEAHERAEIEDLRRGYVAEVQYLDAQLGRLLDAWEERSSSRSDLVLLTADHGEGLAEHGYVGHSRYLYEEQLRVPLVLRMPERIPAGSSVREVTSSIDVAATLLELIEVPAPPSFGGTSLLERALSPEVDANAFAIAERQTLTGARGRLEGQEASQADAGALRLVAAVQGAWKFVWSEDGSDELYQLRNDPYEQHNLIGQRPEREARMRMLVERFNRTTPIAVLPSEPVPNQGNLMDALGYGGGED